MSEPILPPQERIDAIISAIDGMIGLLAGLAVTSNPLERVQPHLNVGEIEATNGIKLDYWLTELRYLAAHVATWSLTHPRDRDEGDTESLSNALNNCRDVLRRCRDSVRPVAARGPTTADLAAKIDSLTALVAGTVRQAPDTRTVPLVPPCPVELRGESEAALVRGKSVELPGGVTYRAVKALVEAHGKPPLTEGELRDATGDKDPARALRDLCRNNKSWSAVIVLPGRGKWGKGYSIRP